MNSLIAPGDMLADDEPPAPAPSPEPVPEPEPARVPVPYWLESAYTTAFEPVFRRQAADEAIRGRRHAACSPRMPPARP